MQHMNYKFELIEATILKRYKRFLSDIELENGEIICAHVPNTGSMTACWAPGWKAYITQTDDPKRKLKYTLELTHNGESFICVNTGMTNKLVAEALENKVITELAGYNEIKAEKKVLDSRLDFFLTEDGLADAYVEVKNVTLKLDPDRALFPDAVTTRGQKHLKDLMLLKSQGHRAVMLYIINRTDVKTFEPASEIDPEYAKLLRLASQSGVEIMAYQSFISTSEILIKNKIEVLL